MLTTFITYKTPQVISFSDLLRIPTELFHLTLVCSDQFECSSPTNGMSPHDHCGKPGEATMFDCSTRQTFQRMLGIEPNVRHSGDPQEWKDSEELGIHDKQIQVNSSQSK